MRKKNKKKRIESLTKELEAISFTPITDTTNFYPFSNERGLEDPIESLAKITPQSFSKGTLRIAILIGQSSFCSILPELSRHCDLIIFNDLNPFLIQHVRLLLSQLQIAISPENFEERYFALRGNLFNDFKEDEVTPDLNMRKKTLGIFHFLHNPRRFAICQKAAQTMNFAFCHANLFSPADQKIFFDTLGKRKCRVTFFNATNLYEWDAKTPLAHIKNHEEWQPEHRLEKIFSSMNPCITMGSLRLNSGESCALKAMLFFSVASYFSANEINTQKYLKKQIAAAPWDPKPPIVHDYKRRRPIPLPTGSHAPISLRIRNGQ